MKMVLAGELIVDPTSVLKSICVHDWSMSQLRAAFICLRRYVRCDERKGITHEQRTPQWHWRRNCWEGKEWCMRQPCEVVPHQEEFFFASSAKSSHTRTLSNALVTAQWYFSLWATYNRFSKPKLEGRGTIRTVGLGMTCLTLERTPSGPIVSTLSSPRFDSVFMALEIASTEPSRVRRRNENKIN